MRDSTQRRIFSHTGVTEKRSTWFEVLPKPWTQVNRKALRGGAFPHQNRLTATSHQLGARMQMALVKVLHSKRNIGLSCRDTQNSSFAFAHLLQQPVTAAVPTRGTSHCFCNTHWTGHSFPGSVWSQRYNVHSSHVTKGSLEWFHLSKAQPSPEHPLGQDCVLFAQPSPRFFHHSKYISSCVMSVVSCSCYKWQKENNVKGKHGWIATGPFNSKHKKWQTMFSIKIRSDD